MKATVLGGLLMVLAAPALASPSISKPESRNQAPEKVIQTLTAQLGDILVPPPPVDRRKPPERPLNRIAYMTAPHATDVAGICRSTSVVFRMEPIGSEPADPEQWDADTRVKVSDISARTYYAFLAPPAGQEPVYNDEKNETAAEATCRKLDPYKTNFNIEADNDSEVALGYIVMKKLIAALRASPAFALNCPSGPKGEVDCHSTVANLDPAGFTVVNDCGRSPVDDRLSCLRVSYMSVDLQIYVDNDHAPHAAVMSEFVITGDLMKD